MKKRFFTFFLILCITLTLCPTLAFPSYAQSSLTLQQLQNIFPQDKYWNHQVKYGHGYNGNTHYGSACGDVENTWTNYPCSLHPGIPPVGGYDCNCYAGSLQCCGFAKKLANLAYGQSCTNWSQTKNLSKAISIVKPGDVIWYWDCYTAPDTGHWVFVTAVSGSVITVGECNGPKTDNINDGKAHGCIYGQEQYCRINWTRRIDMNRITSFTLYSAPSALSTGAATVKVSFSEVSTSNISETNALVKFNASISGGVSYQIGLEVDGVKTYIYPKTFTMSNIPNSYDLTAECGIILQPNTNYKWRAIVKTADKSYYSDYYSFTTQGCSTHTYSNWTTVKSATCTEAGQRSRTCSVCGYTEYDTEKAPGHNWSKEWTVDIEPTYTSGGVKSHHCTRCSAKTDETKIDPLTADSSIIYKDISKNAWYKSAIDFVTKQGLMNGVSNGKFCPNSEMTRAMLVTVLFRSVGSPKTNSVCVFTDLKQNWYKDAVIWAAQNGIVNGVSPDKFDPDSYLTREQMATIIYRFAKYKKDNTSERGNLYVFADAKNISNYALDALSWCNSKKLITGTVINKKNCIDPRGNATRAQVATILMRYYQSN